MQMGIFITLEELTGERLALADVIDALRPLPVRHFSYLIARVNLLLRGARLSSAGEGHSSVQWQLCAAYLSPEMRTRLEANFGPASPNVRPVIVPHVLLLLMRLSLAHCKGEAQTDNISNDVHYLLGRLCLALNGLMFTEDDLRDLDSLVDVKRLEMMMVQMAAPFEAQNPAHVGQICHRIQIMYRVLLSDVSVTQDIRQRCSGFDFTQEFTKATGMSIERWLFIITAIYAYFLQGSLATDGDTTYVALNATIFAGASRIEESELQDVLRSISSPLDSFHDPEALSTDYRHDLVQFRARPLVQLEESSYVCADINFLLEKCHLGLLWIIQPALKTKRERDLLFNAWGVLFEHYVRWLLKNVRTSLSFSFFGPTYFSDNHHEAFDGLALRDSVAVPMECKGGILARDARYSQDADLFLAEIEKKIGKGTKQLATKIGSLFPAKDSDLRLLTNIPLEHVRVVVPLLVVQDSMSRGPLMNWYLNRRFQDHLSEENLSANIIIRPLTLIHVQEFEAIVNSLEVNDFNFIYALQNRCVRDPEVTSDLSQYLHDAGIAHTDSKQSAMIRNDFFEPLMGYLFPGEALSS